jgi:hypothetical protein
MRHAACGSGMGMRHARHAPNINTPTLVWIKQPALHIQFSRFASEQKQKQEMRHGSLQTKTETKNALAGGVWC